MKDKDEILLGAGELYLSIFTGTEIPEDSVLETETSNVGHCSGGLRLIISLQNTMF